MANTLADKVVYSTKIYPGYGQRLVSGGIAIRGNRITAVGSREELEPYIGEDAEVIDYADHLVLPGFIDNHQHYPMNIFMENGGIDLYDAPSPDFCVEEARKAVRANPDALIVYGMGWQMVNWKNLERMPDRYMLDEVSKEIPICLGSDDGWMFWVNSTALEYMGFKKGSIPEELADLVQTDAEGEPTGLLHGDASNRVFFFINYLPEEDQKKAASEAFGKYLSYGVTAFGEVSNEFRRIDQEIATFDLVEDLHRGPTRNRTPRMFYYPCIGRDGDFSVAKKLRDRYIGVQADPSIKDRVELRGLKGYIDGVMSMNTSVMLENYLNEPKNGTPIYTQENLNRIVAAANAEGFAVRIHATGDGGVRMCLDAYEHSIRVNGRHGLRNCVEHIEACSEEDRRRFRQLGVIAAINPGHAILEEDLSGIISEEAFYELHPFRGLLDKGAIVSLSTDAPIVTCNPMFTIYAAVTRLTEEGEPVIPKPGEEMTIWEALEGYTSLSAYTLGVEDRIGSIRPGLLADLVVLDTDITASDDPQKILSAKPIAVYFDGTLSFHP